MGYFSMLAAIPGFFLSSLFVMLLWGVVAPGLGLKKIEYPVAMLVTITSWIAIGPLAFTFMRFAGWQWWWRGPRS